MPLLARRFSITNFLIASTALGFQVFVLYPWHTKLDDDFAELRQENVRMMELLERRYGFASAQAPAAIKQERREERQEAKGVVMAARQ
jgi:hypothetical protein